MLVEVNPMGYGGRGWMEVNPMVEGGGWKLTLWWKGVDGS